MSSSCTRSIAFSARRSPRTSRSAARIASSRRCRVGLIIRRIASALNRVFIAVCILSRHKRYRPRAALWRSDGDVEPDVAEHRPDDDEWFVGLDTAAWPDDHHVGHPSLGTLTLPTLSMDQRPDFGVHIRTAPDSRRRPRRLGLDDFADHVSVVARYAEVGPRAAEWLLVLELSPALLQVTLKEQLARSAGLPGVELSYELVGVWLVVHFVIVVWMFGGSGEMTDETNGRALLTTAEAACELGLPGPWTLRRLEVRGVVPKARRTPITRRRYYSRSEIAALQSSHQGRPVGGLQHDARS